MDVMEEVGRFSAADIAAFDKEKAEENVVPKGQYEGTVFTWNEILDDKKSDSDLYKGYTVYKVGVKCYDVGEPGKTKTAWVKVSGVAVRGPNGRMKAPSAGGLQLTKAMGMPDAAITDVLDQAKVTRAVYNIEVWEKDNPDAVPGDDSTAKLPGGNWLKGVRAL